MTRFRPRRSTRTTASGTKVVTTTMVKAPELEWVLQAAAIRRLHQMDGYTNSPDLPGTFTVAGDFNAARRSPKEAMKAKATGLTPGEHDIRVYIADGRLGLIEMKGEKGRLSADQKARHAVLGALGFGLQAVVRASTEHEAADQVEAVVRGWLALEAANDNAQKQAKVSA